MTRQRLSVQLPGRPDPPLDALAFDDPASGESLRVLDAGVFWPPKDPPRYEDVAWEVGRLFQDFGFEVVASRLYLFGVIEVLVVRKL